MNRRNREVEARVRATLRHRAERLQVSPRPFDPQAEPSAGSAEVTRRSIRPRLLVAAAALTLVVAGIAIVATRSGRDDSTSQVNAAGSHQTVPPEPEAGDPAVWTVDSDSPPSPTASSFTALVNRLGCHGGETGRVLRPGVVFSDTEITVTFNVEADPGRFTCPGNNQVPYEVDLGQPIGPRVLADGSCRPDGPAQGTSICNGGDVRWKAATSGAPAGEPHRCQAASSSDLDVAHEPPWRQYAQYLPWTDRDGCLIRIDVLAERPGPEHCGWESARVIIVGRPMGSRYTNADDTTEYVHDPGGVFGKAELTDGFQSGAVLPNNAVDSGYRRDNLAIWHISGDESFIWVVSPDTVERWPAGPTPLCN